MTLGVEILGKTLDKNLFKPFTSVSELIDFKRNMRNAPTGNVPIQITEFNDRIEVSGRLYKSGHLSHDPNIGALTIISKTLRFLGWNKDIVITQHGLSQNHLTPRNKFIRIANQLNIKLDGLHIPQSSLADEYWHYEESSEKVATIFLHLILEELNGVEVIYENHAGCERGYFKSKSGQYLVIHKYIDNDKSKGILKIPDLIVCDKERKCILIVEGKRWDKLTEGINALAEYDPIEREYINKYYSDYNISRHVVLFGGPARTVRNPHVAFLLNSNGELIFSDYTPETIKEAIRDLSKPN